MNKFFNNLIIYNGYPLSVVLALVMHTSVFIAVLYFQSRTEIEALELVQPTVIKALFIDENPQVRNQRIQEQRRVDLQRQRELEQQRQAETERQAEAERQERERQEAAARQRREEEQRQAALREREELERLRELEREAQLRREQEARDNELRQRQEREAAELAERRRREEENRRQQQAAAEAAAAEAARNEFELVQSATGLIQQIVQENWSRPPSARNGMRAILQIRMLPTGELVDVTITQSSGDPAFDRSAESAVYRAAPFSELRSLPINVFNANFRSLSLIFEPEDLLN